MGCRIRLATSVLASVILGAHVGLATVNARQAPGISVLSLTGGTVARVVALSRNPEFPALAVVLDRGGSQRVVPLHYRLIEVTRLMESPTGLLIVLGNTGSAHTVTVIDPVAAVIRDHLAGLHPLTSPDGRFVAFQNHRVPDDPLRSVARIYDTALPPDRNRVPGVPADDIYSVGIPVYPLSNLKGRQVEPIFENGRGEKCGFRSSVWLAPTVLAFLERCEDRSPTLVVVDLEHGGERPDVHVDSLDARVILEPDMGSGGSDPWYAPWPQTATIALLEADAGHIRVRVDWKQAYHPGSRSQVFEFAR
jgi:hypothetical protein